MALNVWISSALLLTCLCALSSCVQQDKPIGQTAGRLPDTPEEVVRQYQVYLDQNDFNRAKTLSTSREAERLDEVSRVVAAESQDSTRTCTIRDQYETYDTDFVLIRYDRRWLVDSAPQEEILFDEEEIEEALNGMLKQIR
jgi:putative lipase involved disintegration of autophagic bodies